MKGDVGELGESILYLKTSTRGVNNFDRHWEYGTWLGVCDETSGNIFGACFGFAEVRWSTCAIRELKGVPLEPMLGQAEGEILVRVNMPGEERAPQLADPGEEKPEVRRRVHNRRDDDIKNWVHDWLPSSCHKQKCPIAKHQRSMS